jgi:hypothetical protein
VQSRNRCKNAYELQMGSDTEGTGCDLLQMGSDTEGTGCDLFQNIFSAFFWGNRLKVR